MKDMGGQEFNAVAFCPEANKDPIKLVKILFFTKMFSIHWLIKNYEKKVMDINSININKANNHPSS